MNCPFEIKIEGLIDAYGYFRIIFRSLNRTLELLVDRWPV